MARFYGLMPWDMQRLRRRELQHVMQHLDQLRSTNGD